MSYTSLAMKYLFKILSFVFLTTATLGIANAQTHAQANATAAAAPVVEFVEIYTTTCPYCKRFAAIYDRLESDFAGQVTFHQYDFFSMSVENQKRVARYGVPYIFIKVNGVTEYAGAGAASYSAFAKKLRALTKI